MLLIIEVNGLLGEACDWYKLQIQVSDWKGALRPSNV